MGLDNGFATDWPAVVGLGAGLPGRFTLLQGDLRDPSALEEAFRAAIPGAVGVPARRPGQRAPPGGPARVHRGDQPPRAPAGVRRRPAPRPAPGGLRLLVPRLRPRPAGRGGREPALRGPARPGPPLQGLRRKTGGDDGPHRRSALLPGAPGHRVWSGAGDEERPAVRDRPPRLLPPRHRRRAPPHPPRGTAPGGVRAPGGRRRRPAPGGRAAFPGEALRPGQRRVGNRVRAGRGPPGAAHGLGGGVRRHAAPAHAPGARGRGGHHRDGRGASVYRPVRAGRGRLAPHRHPGGGPAPDLRPLRRRAAPDNDAGRGGPAHERPRAGVPAHPAQGPPAAASSWPTVWPRRRRTGWSCTSTRRT